MDFFVRLKNARLIALFISILVNIALVSLCLFFIYQNYNYTCPICESKLEQDEILVEEEAEESLTKTFYVEVKGAVQNPGVFEVNDNNIINDLITLAGGFKKNAFTNNINLSKKLTKELVVYVYTKDEINDNKNTLVKEVQVKECVCPTYDISLCTEEKQSEIIPDNKTNNQENSNVSEDNYLINTLVNINMASKEELMTLSGIGESKALDIIDYRNTFGNFKTIEEITNVKGIGNTIYEKIKDYITV